MAVDNLVEGFVKAGLKPLRVGFGSRIRASLRDYSLDYLLTKHPLQPLCLETIALLNELEEEINQLSSRLSETLKKLENGGSSKALKERAENMYRAMAMKDRQQTQLKAKIYGLQQEMLHDIVKSADVVSVLSGSSTRRIGWLTHWGFSLCANGRLKFIYVSSPYLFVF